MGILKQNYIFHAKYANLLDADESPTAPMTEWCLPPDPKMRRLLRVPAGPLV